MYRKYFGTVLSGTRGSIVAGDGLMIRGWYFRGSIRRKLVRRLSHRATTSTRRSAQSRGRRGRWLNSTTFGPVRRWECAARASSRTNGHNDNDGPCAKLVRAECSRGFEIMGGKAREITRNDRRTCREKRFRRESSAVGNKSFMAGSFFRCV